MTDELLVRVALGVAAMLAIFVGTVAAMRPKRGMRRALALFSAAVGVAITMSLKERPELLAKWKEGLVISGLLAVAALLRLSRRA